MSSNRAEQRILISSTVQGAHDRHRRSFGHFKAKMVKVTVNDVEIIGVFKDEVCGRLEAVRAIRSEAIIPQGRRDRRDQIAPKRRITWREKRDLMPTLDESGSKDTDYPLDAAITHWWHGQERRTDECDLHFFLLISTGT